MKSPAPCGHAPLAIRRCPGEAKPNKSIGPGFDVLMVCEALVRGNDHVILQAVKRSLEDSAVEVWD